VPPSQFNRTAERGQALAYEFGVRFGGAPSAFDAQAFDGVVNAAAAAFRAPDTGPLASTQLQPHPAPLEVMTEALLEEIRQIG